MKQRQRKRLIFYFLFPDEIAFIDRAVLLSGLSSRVEFLRIVRDCFVSTVEEIHRKYPSGFKNNNKDGLFSRKNDSKSRKEETKVKPRRINVKLGDALWNYLRKNYSSVGELFRVCLIWAAFAILEKSGADADDVKLFIPVADQKLVNKIHSFLGNVNIDLSRAQEN